MYSDSKAIAREIRFAIAKCEVRISSFVFLYHYPTDKAITFQGLDHIHLDGITSRYTLICLAVDERARKRRGNCNSTGGSEPGKPHLYLCTYDNDEEVDYLPSHPHIRVSKLDPCAESVGSDAMGIVNFVEERCASTNTDWYRMLYGSLSCGAP